jgi:hypothetical protein
MTWCVMRQDIVNLTSGTYKTSTNIVDVDNMLKRAAASAGKVNADFSNKTDGLNMPCQIAFDERMARLALENAISNAVAHGDGTGIEIEAIISEAANVDQPSSQCYLSFCVMNFVSSETLLTNEKLETLASTNTSRSFTPSSKPVSHGVPSSKSYMSTQLGLHHIGLACKAANGFFDMKLEQRGERNVVVTTITLPAEMHQNNVRDCPSATVSPKDVERSMARLSSVKLTVGAIDDSSMMCKGYQKLLLPLLDADVDSSFIICPESIGDIDRFYSLSTSSIPNRKSPNVIILDQNIDLPAHPVSFSMRFVFAVLM